MSKNISKKLIVIVIAVLLAVTAVTGGTVAYLLAESPSVENSFKPVYVSCLVEEKFDGVTKSDVKIKNTGDISAYIRATFVVMWVAEDGSVLSRKPVLDADYSLTPGSSKWALGSDGFYYYTLPVASGKSTELLIDTISLTGTAPKGHSLTVHVAATAIQAEPHTAVTQGWGVQIQADGTLVAP